MNKDIIHYAKNRYTTKVFDSSKKISNENVEKIKDLLRLSPSSVNSQPWHFIITGNEEGKKRIAKSTDNYPFNKQALLDCSHIVVFCSRLEIQEDYLLDLLKSEDKDGRFVGKYDVEALKEQRHAARNFFVNLHKHDYKDVQHWMDKQTYLNLGQFLLGVATLDIDATPMEGIDTKTLDEEFTLREKGYTSLVAVALGYRDADKDFNAKLPKSRLCSADVFTEV